MNSRKTGYSSTKHGFFMGLGCIGAVLALLVVLSILWVFVLIPATAVPYCPQNQPGEFYSQQDGVCEVPGGLCDPFPTHCNQIYKDYTTQPILRSPFQP